MRSRHPPQAHTRQPHDSPKRSRPTPVQRNAQTARTTSSDMTAPDALDLRLCSETRISYASEIAVRKSGQVEILCIVLLIVLVQLCIRLFFYYLFIYLFIYQCMEETWEGIETSEVGGADGIAKGDRGNCKVKPV